MIKEAWRLPVNGKRSRGQQRLRMRDVGSGETGRWQMLWRRMQWMGHSGGGGSEWSLAIRNEEEDDHLLMSMV